MPDLPILDALPELIRALQETGAAVLQAPPGAGKTTVVPLAMLDASIVTGKIMMLEPRRLAARAAAERMASTLGEPVGDTVGYRVRGQSKTSSKTRIEVVTEGILTRMIQSDPSLQGIGAVIFDEFHERSLNGDLGLALVWESRSALREDLVVLVMSATLDAEPVAEMLAAPVVTSAGRAFPVDTRWLDRPVPKDRRFEDAMADLIVAAAEETKGGILAFLPGEGEIRRVETRLKGRLPSDCHIHTLFGAMDFRAQRAAIEPAISGRKLVLATSIAETSLTLADIRVVVDGGMARRARFDPGSGMSRLVTERVSKAEATQRQGRAGRVAEGQCYRLWTRGQEGGMTAFPPAEIEAADLSALVLDLAQWGARDTAGMAFLTGPNPKAFSSAQDLLRGLGALDAQGAITAHGRDLAAIPTHPRLAHMIRLGGKGSETLAALLGERDPLRGAPVDIALRKDALAGKRSREVNAGAMARIRQEAKRLARFSGVGPALPWSTLAALAYPDRIGMRRNGETPRWILSGGKEAAVDPSDPIAGARMIVAVDLDGDTRSARLRLATEITEAELREIYADQMHWTETCEWSSRERRVVARQQERLGAIIIQDRIWNDATDTELARAALTGIRDLGLPHSKASDRFRARVALARHGGAALPDMSETALLDSLEEWLLPFVTTVRNAADIRKIDLLDALRQRLNWSQMTDLEKRVPEHFTTPMDRKTPIDYAGEAPEITLRLQEMFGVSEHPTVAGTSLRVTLLSPAGRPLQTTTDLPGFWATSYDDVRKEMRGRYPRHPWPEDPTKADPTLRAKRRKD